MNKRGKKAIYNSLSAILSEIVSIICGLILPRMILRTFGSSYNGLTSSITTFISYIVLLKSGIGGVTRAALYKPLAQKDNQKISGIVNATSRYMRKIAIIFLGLLVLYAVIYPFLVIDEFSWIFSASLIVIIGVTTFIQYYFVLAYQMLLKADQKEYITLLINSFTMILNTIIAVIVMKLGFNIHMVKLSSAIVHILPPIFLTFYIKKHYGIDKNVAPDNVALKQRWDSLAHAIAGFVHGNTDVVILTIFTNTLEISVYSVYNYIVLAIRKGITAITTGMEAAFGNIIANGEIDLLKKRFNLYEWFVFTITSIIISTAIVMCLPFIGIYTDGVTDVEYIRPTFCYLIIVAEFFYCVRIPYEDIVRAFGHYKQTRNAAIVEPIINILISVILVSKYGMVGVAIGTLIAIIFRTLRYSIYVQKNLINRNLFDCVRPYIISIMVICSTLFLTYYVVPNVISNYIYWGIWSFIIIIFSAFFSCIFNYLFNRCQFIDGIGYIKKVFKKKLVKS